MNPKTNNSTVWITRSEPGASHCQKTWEAAGFRCFVRPLIDISVPAKMPRPIADRGVLLITSQNALRTLKILTDRRDWPVMAVGDASANLARRMGFEDVMSAKGNANDLLELVQKIYDPSSPHQFVYASGSDVRLDLAKALRDKGYKARRDVYYRNVMKPAVDISGAPNLTHIALYSPMAAKAARRYAGRLNNAKTISISAQTDEALGERFKNRRLIANRPNEAQMIAAVLP